jgi:hypothetical protein
MTQFFLLAAQVFVVTTFGAFLACAIANRMDLRQGIEPTAPVKLTLAVFLFTVLACGPVVAYDFIVMPNQCVDLSPWDLEYWVYGCCCSVR